MIIDEFNSINSNYSIYKTFIKTFGSFLLYVSVVTLCVQSHFMCPDLTSCVRFSVYVSQHFFAFSHFMCPIKYFYGITIVITILQWKIIILQLYFNLTVTVYYNSLIFKENFKITIQLYIIFYRNYNYLTVVYKNMFGL